MKQSSCKLIWPDIHPIWRILSVVAAKQHGSDQDLIILWNRFSTTERPLCATGCTTWKAVHPADVAALMERFASLWHKISFQKIITSKMEGEGHNAGFTMKLNGRWL